MHGKEIDCILENGEKVTPIEIKSGRTMSASYFDNLRYWKALASMPEEGGVVVYGGDLSRQTGTGALVSWRQLKRILE